jgi:predicted DCC family thiol-disulfide oxidoreductase YuxK
MLTTCTKPVRDTVLYDGRCGFCRQRVANLQRADLWHRLTFISLHDESVARDFPEVPAERLHDEMVVIDTHGHVRGGATAVRYLSRTLPLLWPLALVLHVPGSLPIWNWLYRLVARNRMRLAGSCETDACRR